MIPEEYHEPVLMESGLQDRNPQVNRVLLEAPRHCTPDQNGLQWTLNKASVPGCPGCQISLVINLAAVQTRAFVPPGLNPAREACMTVTG